MVASLKLMYCFLRGARALPSFLHTEVFSVAYLVILVVGNYLLLLSGPDACSECCGCRSRVIWCQVRPCHIGNDHPVLLVWDDACKVALALALVKVV